MKDNPFFKPTPLFKEFMILDLIEKDSKITQRDISKSIGTAVSMVNAFLDTYEQNGLIKRKRETSKTIDYVITKKGIERKKVLNIMYLASSLNVFNSAKENVVVFLEQIAEKGYKNILLYGAGEVAEILLQTIMSNKELNINVLAIIDDDSLKKWNYLLNTKIITPKEVNQYNFEGILVSSYTHQQSILEKLNKMDYPKENVLYFFNE